LLDSVIIPALLNKGILLDLKSYRDSLHVNLDVYFPWVWKNNFALAYADDFFYLGDIVDWLVSGFYFIYIMTAGGPLHSPDVVVYHIYKNAGEYLKMGYASAMSWVLFLCVMDATWLQFKLIGTRVDY